MSCTRFYNSTISFGDTATKSSTKRAFAFLSVTEFIEFKYASFSKILLITNKYYSTELVRAFSVQNLK